MKTLLQWNKKMFLIFSFFAFFSFLSLNAQLKVDSIGRIQVGVPNSLTNDLNGVLSMQIFGKYTNTYSSGGKLAFGDFGRKEYEGCNVFVGEYGTTDTDRLWLHGKRGIYLTYGNSDPVIAYYDIFQGNAFHFNCGVESNGYWLTPQEESSEEEEEAEEGAPNKQTIAKTSPLTGALSSLQKIEGVNFALKTNTVKYKSNLLDKSNLTDKEKEDIAFFENWEQKEKNSSNSRKGFIAQNMKNVFPELVRENKDGKFSIDYSGLIPVIVESIKEQQQIIDAQSEKIKELERIVNKLSGESNLRAELNTTTNNNIPNVNLVNAYLYQNTPNPFTYQTEIQYFVPSEIKQAYICIFDMQGKLLKKLDAQTGTNTITVRGSELQAGMYLYSLIVDGQEIDTKRMILTK
jgi:hypothetical protein